MLLRWHTSRRHLVSSVLISVRCYRCTVTALRCTGTGRHFHLLNRITQSQFYCPISTGTESTQGDGHESKACREAIRPALLGNPQPKILTAQNTNRTIDLQDVSLTHTDINTHDSIWEGRATFPEELSLMGRFRTHHSTCC